MGLSPSFKSISRRVYITSEFFKGANGTLHGERTFIPENGNPKDPVTVEDLTVELCYSNDDGPNPEVTVTIKNLSGLKLTIIEETENPLNE